MRLAIVSDDDGKWYIRRIRVVEHNLTDDEKVYHCDKHLGGPFDRLGEAAASAMGQASVRRHRS